MTELTIGALLLTGVPAIALAVHYHRKAQLNGANPGHAWWTLALSLGITMVGAWLTMVTITSMTPTALLKLGPEGWAFWTLLTAGAGWVTSIGAGILPQWLIVRRLTSPSATLQGNALTPAKQRNQ